MLLLLDKNEAVHTYAFNGRWLDIGVPADYEKAQEEFETRRDIYLRSMREPST
jgi:NDP-sugar pyrophosphorylase family protein